ncbi:MAG: hypothetical protein OXC26_16410 [Albidovulum sp.]|nr:hypothetical protein [Albidovulum sp.]
MTEIISLVTSVAASLSAITAPIVMQQNYKQRSAFYRPEPVLVRTNIQSTSD